MSYEINIISVGQTVPSSNDQAFNILVYNEVEHHEIQRYFKIWPLFSSTSGVLYSIGQNLHGFFSSFPICDSDFESDIAPDLIPEFLPLNVKHNMTPLIIYEQYYEDVERVIRMLIQDSPLKTILFQTRYQGGDYEVFYGVLTASQFFERLKEHTILFNVCYIVRDDTAICAELAE